MNTVRVSNLELELEPFENSEVAQELAVAGTAVAAAALAGGVTHVMICVKTNSVLATIDGTAPVSAGAGFLLTAGIYYWSKQTLARARFIEAVGSAPAVIRIEPMSS